MILARAGLATPATPGVPPLPLTAMALRAQLIGSFVFSASAMLYMSRRVRAKVQLDVPLRDHSRGASLLFRSHNPRRSMSGPASSCGRVIAWLAHSTCFHTWLTGPGMGAHLHVLGGRISAQILLSTFSYSSSPASSKDLMLIEILAAAIVPKICVSGR